MAHIPTINPNRSAEAFRLLLAQKGYTSTLRALASGAVMLTASDGKQVLFTKAVA